MKPRVLFVSGREVDYMRNRVLLAALSTHFDVTVLTPKLAGTTGRILAGLARSVAHRSDHDICFAGFYGQPIAIGLATLQHKPIVLDAYVSTYDTLCEDRRRFRSGSAIGRLALWLDQRSSHLAARVLTDTKAHAHYFATTLRVPADKIDPVYVGCDESIFYPRDPEPTSSEFFNVFYYGAFLPLHGTEIIVEAAALLRDHPNIRFTIGGDGMRHQAVKQMVADLGLTNVDLVGWISMRSLPEYIARATICLGGHFSTVPKAARVISTKTFQFVAMRKPTVAGDNPATREVFVPGDHVCAVPMGDPQSLAEAIRVLADSPDLRLRLAEGGYQVFQQRLTTRSIAKQLRHILETA